MPRDAKGNAIDIIVNPLGVISRGNPAQISEAILGKIVAKTGVPYEVRGFTDENIVDFTLKEMKKHGIQDTEEIFDPELNRHIPGVLVGNRFYQKLHHTVSSKASERALGAYTMEGTPARSVDGEDKPKRIGLGEMAALISHGAVENIRELKTVKGQRNDEYWRAMALGYNPPSPDIPNVYKKMMAMFQGAGINVKKRGEYLHLTAMTDRDVIAMSSGEITKPDLVKWTSEYGRGLFGEQSLDPIKGGLMDRGITGGHGGNRFAHITLSEPMPSPVMEEPIRRILGLTKREFEDVVAGRKSLPGVGSGGAGIREALKRIKLPDEITRQKEVARSSRNGAERDLAIKRIKFLEAMQKQKTKPEDLVLTKVPVIPPIFRPVTANSKFTLVTGINRLYMDLMNADSNLSELGKSVEGDPVHSARLNTYHALKAVTGMGDPIKPELRAQGVRGLLKDVFGGSPKLGLFQRRLIGTPVDLAGRTTIIPNPNLDMDQIGIPEDQAWTLYAPFVTRRLVRSMGNRPDARAAAIRHVAERSQVAKNALTREMNERPVLVNRAPSLHKFSIMAFYPTIAPGKALEVSPTIVQGFNADFDGDEQLGNVLINIDIDVASALTCDYGINMEDHRMYNCDTAIPTLSADSKLYVFDLEDVPHGDLIRSKIGKNGRIDFHHAVVGMRVLAYDEAACKLIWADLGGWSIHYDREIEIVELSGGRQIVTDDNPRAVYGTPAGELKMQRFTPAKAHEVKALVPCAAYPPAPDVQGTRRVFETHVSDTGTLDISATCRLDTDFGYLLGTLIGDGWVTYLHNVPKVINLANTCVAVSKAFHSSLQAVVGIDVHLCVTDMTKSYGRSRRYTYGNKLFAEFISAHDLIGRTSGGKHLPAFFLSSCCEFREGLFAGLMDTDGSISVSHGKSKPQLMASYTSISLRLIREIKLLAGSLGIRSRIAPTTTPAGNRSWVLTFSAPDIQAWGGKGMASVVKLEKLASVPRIRKSSATAKNDIVPIPEYLALELRKRIGVSKISTKLKVAGGSALTAARTRMAIYQSLYQAGSQASPKYGAISRQQATAIIVRIGREEISKLLGAIQWLQVVDNVAVTWLRVKNVICTGIKETGYDLTVPGYETFMSVDGILLSNTMNFHVIVGDKAIEEAKRKMLPSRNLRSPADFGIMWAPRQEFLQGLYLASTRRSGRRMLPEFDSARDVLAAFARGKASIEDVVRIKD